MPNPAVAWNVQKITIEPAGLAAGAVGGETALTGGALCAGLRERGPAY